MNEIMVAAIGGGFFAAVVKLLEIFINRQSARRVDSSIITESAISVVETLRSEIKEYRDIANNAETVAKSAKERAIAAEQRAIAAEQRVEWYLRLIYAHMEICANADDLRNNLGPQK
jgi:hypothetical protein